ncbi:hypothetical protein GGI43DRAFT_389415 [Trichoderma evansii]
MSSLMPAPEEPPACRQCGEESKRYITRPTNRNGNAGRPYYKCDRCPKFAGFADTRGNDPNNPPCDCGASSRRQLASRVKGRKIHYVCRLGKCNFYGEQPNAIDGSVATVDGDELASAFAMLGIF